VWYRRCVRVPRTVKLAAYLALALCSALALSGSALASSKAAPKPTAISHAASPTPIDPDLTGKSSADAAWSLQWLGNGKYQLLVQSTSGVGFIDSFDWVAGPGFTITSVTSSSQGKCALVGDAISCTGSLKPPKCTCLPGGSMTIKFTATGDTASDPKGTQEAYGEVGSYIAIKTVTPVPYHIPSSLNTSSADVPLCKAGQKSTKAKPCANP